MHVYSNILEMVGRTPMLRVNRLDTGPCQLFLKLELTNPGGSIKDRIGVSMIEQAEKRGELSPVTRSSRRRRATPASVSRLPPRKKATG